MLLSGAGPPLPKLPPLVYIKAEKQLKKLGVYIVHNVGEIGRTVNADGTTTSDILISMTGVGLNTGFLSSHMMNGKGT